MALVLDPDLLRSASHRNMVAHLCGPLSGGATDRVLAIDAAGHLAVGVRPRYALVVAAPAQPLGKIGLLLTARLDGAAADLPSLEFAPYTEASAFLPLFWPAPGDIDSVTGTSAPFGLKIGVASVDSAGALTPVPASDVAKAIEVRLIEGNLGRLIYLIGAEKLRIRRQGRELGTLRLLSEAHGDALDRFGADLAVPRFADRIRYDATKKEIVTETLTDGAGNPVAEGDADYRRRLGLYRPFLIPNRSNVLAMLNGPGPDTDPNKGPLGALGVAARFRLDENATDFAVAIRLIASPGDKLRQDFLISIRNNQLIFPNNTAATNLIHHSRFVPSATRKQVESLRDELRAAFIFADDAAVAPALATTLRSLGRVLKALGFVGPVTILRAQDSAPSAGSRYELGLGVDITPFTATQLNDLATALNNPDRPKAKDPADPAVVDQSTEALLSAMTSVPETDDPEGDWLFTGCGFRTVHRVDTKTLYLSHFPTSGLIIATQAPLGNGAVPLQALYQAPGDPGANAALQAALAAAAALWKAAGGADWTVLNDMDSKTHWNLPIAQTPLPAITVFQAAGLPAIAKNPAIVPQLELLPSELVRSLKLDATLTTSILAGAPAASDALLKLTGILRDQGIVSVLPLVTSATEVLLVVSVIGLPQAGVNLSDRRATGFRWYTAPIAPLDDKRFNIKAIGSRSLFVPVDASATNPTLAAVVVVGYVRTGLANPYEVHVNLPDKANLNLMQYEFLMNLLEQMYPVGVQINTFSLRQGHVDLEGKETPTPLPPSISRTYRRFLRNRQRGEVGVTLS
jgi:hypothetical protein